MLQRASFVAYADLFASQIARSLDECRVDLHDRGGRLVLSHWPRLIVLRSKLRRAWMLDVLAMILLACRPWMIGVALVFVAFSGVSFRSTARSGWIAVGHVIAFLPVSSRMMQSGLLRPPAASRRPPPSPDLVADLQAGHPAAAGADDRRDDHLDLGASGAGVLDRRHAAIGRNSVLSTILHYWETGSPGTRRLAVLLMLLLALVGFLSLLTPARRFAIGCVQDARARQNLRARNDWRMMGGCHDSDPLGGVWSCRC
jgi:hypothetical protein